MLADSSWEIEGPAAAGTSGATGASRHHA